MQDLPALLRTEEQQPLWSQGSALEVLVTLEVGRMSYPNTEEAQVQKPVEFMAFPLPIGQNGKSARPETSLRPGACGVAQSLLLASSPTPAS